MTDKVEEYREMMDLFRIYFTFSKDSIVKKLNSLNLLLSREEL